MEGGGDSVQRHIDGEDADWKQAQKEQGGCMVKRNVLRKPIRTNEVFNWVLINERGSRGRGGEGRKRVSDLNPPLSLSHSCGVLLFLNSS